MERRALTQCLRSRPTTTLYKTQLLPGRIGLRFSSSNINNNNSNNNNTFRPTLTPTQTAALNRTTNPQQPSSTTDFDQILNTLNFDSTGGAATASANERAPSQPAFNKDDLDVSRRVGYSAATDNLRAASRRVDLKLGPTLGRQVAVEPEKGFDLPAALRTLSAVLNQNRVRATLTAQRFHVRKGQLRKVQKSRRWRTLFKYSFGATVKRIQKIRAQGW
ncbi:hypothetical protein BO94DRAFT_538705 [Aspergillus sclerotioniger CBS 115572]|uniref:Ribosomal protein S21 n=1 Tax=Aspergillus sclerotioniger CBS 115572 TaxID=1450535 RepID=A0A317VNW2_9EURO|nr:hypothetical protein BO94DRAFT_538705 [Aspergillus sclerotioniger CBS 115572]PWY74542.1 hypothetical protein BO94DRAFT_538705 [Aspergillus sclerotioniger CBS 115572]